MSAITRMYRCKQWRWWWGFLYNLTHFQYIWLDLHCSIEHQGIPRIEKTCCIHSWKAKRKYKTMPTRTIIGLFDGNNKNYCKLKKKYNFVQLI